MSSRQGVQGGIGEETSQIAWDFSPPVQNSVMFCLICSLSNSLCLDLAHAGDERSSSLAHAGGSDPEFVMAEDSLDWGLEPRPL